LTSTEITINCRKKSATSKIKLILFSLISYIHLHFDDESKILGLGLRGVQKDKRVREESKSPQSKKGGGLAPGCRPKRKSARQPFVIFFTANIKFYYCGE